MNPVLGHYTSQERQPAAGPELPNNKPHRSPKQSHAEDHTEQLEASHHWDNTVRKKNQENKLLCVQKANVKH